MLDFWGFETDFCRILGLVYAGFRDWFLQVLGTGLCRYWTGFVVCFMSSITVITVSFKTSVCAFYIVICLALWLDI
jgi:hypothetical protein